MTPREAVVDKLKKLWAHMESAQQTSTEEEADAFAQKIRELLTRHKIEEAEVRSRGEGEVKDDPIVQVMVPHGGHETYRGLSSTAEGFPYKRRRTAWSETLAAVVARANYCRILVTDKANSVWFVGRRVDVDASVQTFLYLVASAARISWVEYQRYFDACSERGQPTLARGFRQSFLVGFATRLDERYKEEWKRMREDWLKEQKALVVLKDARVAVDEYVDGLGKDKAKRVVVANKNSAGYARGKAVADDVKLRGQTKEIV